MHNLEYLPMFGIGAFLAAGVDQVSALADRRPIGAGSVTGAALTLSVLWSSPWLPLPRLLLLAACTALVVAFVVWSPAIQLSHSNVVSWLGSRSFSLYLVHEPITVSAALIFPGKPWLALIVAWPLLLPTRRGSQPPAGEPGWRVFSQLDQPTPDFGDSKTLI